MELANAFDVSDEEVTSERAAVYPVGSELVLELQRDIAECNADELRALRVLVDKLKAGRHGKPPLVFATDPRNWNEEIRGELTDALWYLAFRVASGGTP